MYREQLVPEKQPAVTAAWGRSVSVHALRPLASRLEWPFLVPGYVEPGSVTDGLQPVS